MSQQVDERIIKKIRQYVGEGSRSVEEMERLYPMIIYHRKKAGEMGNGKVFPII